jgi:site-specific DNA-methyltransferase (adenine-specific)
MRVYYEDEYVTLYQGDCMADPRPWLSADVLVTDPPYGMAYSSNSSKYNGPSAPIAGDNDPDLRDRALEMWGTGPALVFGTWRVARPAATKQLIVWDKGDSPGMGDLSIPWGPSHEEIYVMGSGFRGKRGGSVIRSKGLGAADANRPNHPTPKPVGLMEVLIEKCPAGWVIADPFAGSGATLVAARNLGRRAIGFELEERYCEIIASRLAQGAFDFGLV